MVPWACVFDGATVRIYVNGAEVVAAAQGDFTTTNADPVSVGGNSPSGDGLDGQIDLFRVWSEPLTADEVCWAAQP